ncbi:hypothetical protein L7F22_015704 [Adiantum nelumboides]|nr:hypothetical protein [Adiantum nelumboides]
MHSGLGLFVGGGTVLETKEATHNGPGLFIGGGTVLETMDVGGDTPSTDSLGPRGVVLAFRAEQSRASFPFLSTLLVSESISVTLSSEAQVLWSIQVFEVRIPAAGRKGEPKNQGEMKDDTNSARDEKHASYQSGRHYFFVVLDMQKHEADGRVIIAEFEQFLLMNTYAPNNGWKEEELSFQRRRKWDQKVLDFVLRISNKRLIWCGDLNVSHEEIDVSHAEFFKNARLQGYVPPRKEDCGQPGFTHAERERFSKILKECDLIDTYRWLQQQKDMDGGFTWSGNPVGKYRGKRMRIDYFLISKMLLPKLMKSTIHGRGIEMEGYGSDHCPITLELSCKLSP